MKIESSYILPHMPRRTDLTDPSISQALPPNENQRILESISEYQ